MKAALFSCTDAICRKPLISARSLFALFLLALLFAAKVQATTGTAATTDTKPTVSVLNTLSSVTITDIDTRRNTIREHFLEPADLVVSGVQLSVSHDGASTATVSWSVSPLPPFLFDSVGGRITRDASFREIDYEASSRAEVVAKAVVTEGNRSVTGTLTVTVEVIDILENSNFATPQDTMSGPNTILEKGQNFVQGLQMGFRLTGGESDEGMTVNWFVHKDSLSSALSDFFEPVSTGRNARVRLKSGKQLDYETEASTQVYVGSIAYKVGPDRVNRRVPVMITVVNVLETATIVDKDLTLNTIAENAVSATAVSGLRLETEDDRNTDLGAVTTSWSLVDDADLFTIDTGSGVLRFSSTATAALDYETSTSHRLVVSVALSQGSAGAASATLTLTVAVLEVLGRIATTDTDTAANTIAENVASGTAVSGLTLQATPDVSTALVAWSIRSGSDRFAIDSNSGALSYASSAALDYETTPSTEVVVQAVASAGGVTITGTLTVTITVLNVLETITVSDSDNTMNTIIENASSGTAVSGLTLQATPDVSTAPVSWSVMPAGSHFAVSGDGSAMRYVSDTALDYEMGATTQVVVEAVASADGVTVTGTLTVAISILNVLETVTVDDGDTTANAIAENSQNGTLVKGLLLQATPDVSTATVIYSIRSGNDRFAINLNRTVRYASAEVLDYETTPSTQVVVQAVANADGVTVTGTLTITISVLNVLEEVVISDSDGSTDNTIAENSSSGTLVSGLSLQATPDVSAATVEWRVVSANNRFAIDSNGGALRYASEEVLDYETDSSIQVVVRAVANADDVTVTGTLTIAVSVLDVLEAVVVSDSDGSTTNTIAENSSSGTAVSGLTLQATPDVSNATVVWSVITANSRFAIDRNSGALRYASVETLDHEVSATTEVIVQAVASASGVTVSSSITVTIVISNVFESLTVIDQNDENNTLTTNATSGTMVASLSLQAQDEAENPVSNAVWSITSDAVPFGINPQDEVVWHSDTSPSGTPSSYTIIVRAEAERGGVTQSGELSVTIEILSTVDGTIVDTASGGSSMNETSAVDTPVPNLTLAARDNNNQPLAGTITWNLVDNAGGLFAIDSASGVVRLASGLDYETSIEHTIEIGASLGNQAVNHTLTVVITVSNVLEAVAISDSNTTANTIAENATVDTAVAGVSLQVQDEGSRALSGLVWSVSSGSRFAINSSGAIRYASTATFDYETTPSTRVVVEAVANASGVTVTGTFTVTVAVLNVLEEVMISDSDSTMDTIAENSPSGTPVSGLALQATFDVSAATVVWSIDSDSGSNRFAISSTSGAIRYASTAALDYEMSATTKVVVQAVASVAGATVTGTLTITVHLTNVLEEITVSDSNLAANAISEDAQAGAVVSGLSLQAQDESDNLISENLIWTIDDTTVFAISNAGVVSLPAAALDYETNPSYTLAVTASRVGIVSEPFTFTITITNVLESIAIVDENSTTNTISDLATSGTEVAGLNLTAKDEGENPVADVDWSLEPSGNYRLFTIDPQTATIKWSSDTAPIRATVNPPYTLSIEAQKSGISATLTLTIEVGMTNIRLKLRLFLEGPLQ